MFPILAQIFAEIAPKGFAVLSHRLELMPTEAIELGHAPPERPFPFDGIIRRGVIRLIGWLAKDVFAWEAGSKINLAANVRAVQTTPDVKMNPAVLVAFGDGDAAGVTLGDDVGEQ